VHVAASAVLDVDPASLGLPPQPAVMVEEYLTGAEFSVEMLDLDIVGVTAKRLGPEPYFLEVGHDFPACVPAPHAAAVGAAARHALLAVGLGWGPAHVEVRYGPAGARIIEVNPRLAGGMIPRVVEHATGIDMVWHAVARAAGRSEAPVATRQRYASIRFLVAQHGGRFAGLDGLTEARAVPQVVEVEPIRAVGTDVVVRHAFTDRLGYVIAVAPSGDAAAAAAEDGLRLLHADIDATTVAPEGTST
jgi:biotin carboxylase